MIRIFISAVLYLITSFTQAQSNSDDQLAHNPEQTFAIRVLVNQIRPETGTVYFAMYSSESDFTDRKGFSCTIYTNEHDDNRFFMSVYKVCEIKGVG